MDLQKNKVYRCQITDYTADGTGVAKIEGRAVFVPRTAVGDQCDVRIVKVTKNVAFGRVEKIIVPSAQRIAPACPVADKCGGCCYQHITYGEELRAKEKKVRDALTRIGGQDGAKLLGITGAPTTEHYRNKAQYPVGRDKRRQHRYRLLPSAQPRHCAGGEMPHPVGNGGQDCRRGA